MIVAPALLAASFTIRGLLPAQEAPAIPEPLIQSITIRATPVEPAYDRRNAEVFRKTLLPRDDQVFHLLAGGINAGQHEGGGKSLEIRRFGYNLDHGGISGGLKVLVDDVQQNQSTQGHGQGYLGSLKGLSPELVDEVDFLNGPFSSEYGDFSGLGVVHIRLRESLPDLLTIRMQGGSYESARGFIGFSPSYRNGDAVLSYEGSFTNGPFVKPLDYRRDNWTGNWTHRLNDRRAFGLRGSLSRNDFRSSGQIPLDQVEAGVLDRYGFLDPGDGGRFRGGTMGAYFREQLSDGSQLKADGFVSRSLFDLYSNFTFLLNDPVNGDGIQQHDSRLQQGANVQYLKPWRRGALQGLITAGGNFHSNQVRVGLYNRVNRTPFATATDAHAQIHNGAGYIQSSTQWLNGRLTATAGLRWDLFRFIVDDRVEPEVGGGRTSTAFQPKLGLTYSPFRSAPFALHANYGRGISSVDARGVARSEGGRTLATTDFTQLAATWNPGKWSVLVSGFFIDRSNELVYIPDDGSLEFLGPTRAYGFETKLSIQLNRFVSFNGGTTKVSNAYYRDTTPREYVDRAPHFTSNAALTLAGWRGWSASARLRAINSYRLDTLDRTIQAAGHTVTDVSVTRQLARNVDFNFAVDNLFDRDYYETQNYFESRLQGQDPFTRIHATPGFGRTISLGLTVRLGGK